RDRGARLLEGAAFERGAEELGLAEEDATDKIRLHLLLDLAALVQGEERPRRLLGVAPLAAAPYGQEPPGKAGPERVGRSRREQGPEDERRRAGGRVHEHRVSIAFVGHGPDHITVDPETTLELGR